MSDSKRAQFHDHPSGIPSGVENKSVVAAASAPTVIGERPKPFTGPKPGFWWLAIVAWVIIVSLVGLRIVGHIFPQQDAETAENGDVAETKSAVDAIYKTQMQYFVGANSILASNPDELLAEAEKLNLGGVAKRLQFVTVAGEMGGPEEALEKLGELKRDINSGELEATEDQEAVIKRLEALYADYAGGDWEGSTLTLTERAEVIRELDWFGELALSPGASADVTARTNVMQPARGAVLMFGALAALMLGGFVAGSIGGLVFGIFIIVGRLQSNVAAGVPYGGVYAETFAVWMLLFVGISVLIALLVPDSLQVFAQVIGMPLSLTALAWPVLRGVPWRQVRMDIGWYWGDSIFEPVWGVVGHISALPILMLGFFLTFILLRLASGGENPLGPDNWPGSHPAVDWIANSGIMGRILIMILAAVMAPVIEETMFRGVLYRHLRDMTASWRVFASVLFSALVSGFIFAAIHPQGLATIPVLMAIAVSFSLQREWRGSLVAPMTAHAFNNGLVMSLVLFLT